MVSFWPWRHHDASPASFEKTLSALSIKITSTQRQLDRARSTGRRVKVLGTLYLGFAYLVYAIVQVLVVGWRHMGAFEWSGMAAGPVVIYVVRAVTGAYYGFRVETLSARLKEHQEERTATIQKLKDATKYDSTLQLLEKYGGSENKPKKGGKKKRDEDEKEEVGGGGGGQGEKQRKPSTPGRTNMPPPPTANIARSATSTPQPGMQQGQSPLPRPASSRSDMDTSAEFAPNAYGPAGPGPVSYPSYPPAPAAPVESHWYDRILDTLLGEDETAPKNRFVLICKQCRLVNGQAPPGTKSLSELGCWKCMACGALNGEMDEGEKIVRDVLGRGRRGPGSETTEEEESDLVDVDRDDIPDEVAEAEPAEQPRKRKGKKKN